MDMSQLIDSASVSFPSRKFVKIYCHVKLPGQLSRGYFGVPCTRVSPHYSACCKAAFFRPAALQGHH